jgi:hypothetical protein
MQKGLLNLGFGAPCEVELDFGTPGGEPLKFTSTHDKQGGSKELPLFTAGDTISGTVRYSGFFPWPLSPTHPCRLHIIGL